MPDSVTVAPAPGAQSIAGTSSPVKMERLRGVDSIRIICALIVALGHFGIFGVTAHPSSTYLNEAKRVSGLLWNGPAAVIVFFIISGFCIHLPFRGGRPLNVPVFMARRFLRVGIPVLIAIGFAEYVLKDTSGIFSVTWSILCEIIYYALYPALRIAAQRSSWNILIASSFVVSFVLALLNFPLLVETHNSYTAFGSGLTWLIGLPCWLLGCKLAENLDQVKAPMTSRLWAYRAGIFALAVVLRVAKFHVYSPLASNCFTLNLFAFPAYLWLGYEIAYFRQRRPVPVLEWMGTWSYSLYLVHPLCWGIISAFHISLLKEAIDSAHFVVVIFALCLSYLFFLLIERPSQLLAAKSKEFVKRFG